MSQSLDSSLSSQSLQGSQHSIEPRLPGTLLSQEQQERRRYRHTRREQATADRAPLAQPLAKRRFSRIRERSAVIDFIRRTRVYVVKDVERRKRLLTGLSWQWDEEKNQWWRPPVTSEISTRFKISASTIRNWWASRGDIDIAPSRNQRLPTRH
jgi:hypothetical protein